jgi:uncharacterized protein
LFGAYISTILQSGVRELANIEGLAELPRVLALLATRDICIAWRTSHETSTFRRQLSVAASRCSKPYSRSFSLPAWSSNLGIRMVKVF